MGDRPLAGRVAVVAGASRGAGRGIACALGDAGATVYVTGRTTRGGPRPRDGAPGTIEDTAGEVTARGGRGIAVRVDHTREDEVAALFARVARDHGRLDVLATAVWGGHDGHATFDEAMAAGQQPFWAQPDGQWARTMDAGPYAYYLAAVHAMRLMAPRKAGLIVGVTDYYFDGAPDDPAGGGQMLDVLAHRVIERLQRAMSVDATPAGIAVVTLMPGFMRTERVELYLDGNERLKKAFRYDLSESPEYLGRAVAALAADRQATAKSGAVCFVADLAREYGFTDVDGRQPPRFAPFG